MQLDIFLKFVSEMEDNCQKLLIGSEIDYRRCIANGNLDKVRDMKNCVFFFLSGIPGHFVVVYSQILIILSSWSLVFFIFNFIIDTIVHGCSI